MPITFTDRDRAEKDVNTMLQRGPDTLDEPVIAFHEDGILDQLYTATAILLHHANPFKHIRISNKTAEWERFQDAHGSSGRFEPSFAFDSVPWNADTFRLVLDEAAAATQQITDDTLQQYGAKTIDAETVRTMFADTFREFTHYVQLAAHIDDRKTWRQHSEALWPMVADGTIQHVRQELKRGFDPTDDEQKTLTAADVKSLWVEELDRLGVAWNVEVRDVAGCFNIPEERTMVVANGDSSRRHYSRSEAALLTVHELFHVVRSYNGIKVAEDSGFPPILGLHTPFYDMTEEGGAVYREHATGMNTPAKDKDYCLRALAAHELHNGTAFHDVVDTLVDHGASLKRAFMLATRNREVLRHHIYYGGYHEQWKNRDAYWPLLMGKVNADYADLLKNEVEADGMFTKPPVTADALFERPPSL